MLLQGRWKIPNTKAGISQTKEKAKVAALSLKEKRGKCQKERSAIGRAHGKRARGKALARFMKCKRGR
jgi:hypothetical protein